MPWWIWILIALACLALEVMTPPRSVKAVWTKSGGRTTRSSITTAALYPEKAVRYSA